MAEVAAAPVTEAGKRLADFLGPQISYLVYYRTYIKDFSKKVVDLSSMRVDVQKKVDVATRRVDQSSQVVARWLEKVDSILADKEKLDAEAKEINSCFNGWCCARYRLGKEAKMKTVDIIDLLNEGKNMGEEAYPAPIQDMDLMQTEDFQAYESTQSAKDLVMGALKNDKISILGVHGMGGVGKTTLMRNICIQVKMEKLFDEFVMVAVSQNDDLKRIQNEIAEELDMVLGQERGDLRARRLITRLKQKKKVLVILDDLWKGLDLLDVGIPCGEHHIGCKVVITTRRKEVCDTMKTQSAIRLDCLSESDSWHLFEKNAGNVDSNLNQLARDVAKECKGLPVALVTLGRAMRNKDHRVWQDVLGQLRDSVFTNIEGMDSKVFKPIKLSFDYLLSNESKSCFLLCCLFPEDHKISMKELLRYVIGERLLEDGSFKQAEKKLHRVIDTLTSSHLLLKGDRDDTFSMHDIIRDVAIMIATSYPGGFIVRAGRTSEGWPGKEKLMECTCISLMENEISELPNKPECPKLLTLSLSKCRALKRIPENFFEGMTSLVTLDLSYTPILSLPSSLARLENLRSLCLDGCSGLQDASLIVKLEKLEIISVKNTSINTLLEKEIQQFPHLKSFDK